MMTRMLLVGLMVIALAAASPVTARAQVSVNIGINLPAPPSLVIVPGTPVAYAPAVPSNYFFYGGQYYVYTHEVWYAAPRYNGPWVVVPPAFIPAPILTVPVRYYRVAPPPWAHWRRDAPPRWDPVWGHQWKAEHKEWEKERKDYEKARKQYVKANEKAYKEHAKDAEKAHKEHVKEAHK